MRTGYKVFNKTRCMDVFPVTHFAYVPRVRNATRVVHPGALIQSIPGIYHNRSRNARLHTCFLLHPIPHVFVVYHGFTEFPEIPENPRTFLKKPVGRNFREFREIFSGDSREFRKSAGIFPESWGVFPRTRAVEHCTRP